MLTQLPDRLDAVNDLAGRTLAWLALAMVLLQFAIVVLRYGFGFGSIAMQEAVVYLHATLFMLAAGYTLQQDAHVRVDILYRRFGPLGQAWVDLLGTLFLLIPVCLLLMIASWGYVVDALGGSEQLFNWQRMEKSRESGGLPLVWVLKSLLVLMPILLLLQAVSMLLRKALMLTGRLPLAPADSEQPLDDVAA